MEEIKLDFISILHITIICPPKLTEATDKLKRKIATLMGCNKVPGEIKKKGKGENKTLLLLCYAPPANFWNLCVDLYSLVTEKNVVFDSMVHTNQKFLEKEFTVVIKRTEDEDISPLSEGKEDIVYNYDYEVQQKPLGRLAQFIVKKKADLPEEIYQYFEKLAVVFFKKKIESVFSAEIYEEDPYSKKILQEILEKQEKISKILVDFVKPIKFFWYVFFFLILINIFF